MQVFKFGGASVKSAENIRNVATIIDTYKVNGLLVVVSAIGKTTNKLSEVVDRYFHREGDPFEALEQVRAEHLTILNDL
ncbi:aspartate kinase, partial [Brucella sp. 21LCYQ03]|nr:aspartate kinase [Brucella sp. 21LCYQ03]